MMLLYFSFIGANQPAKQPFLAVSLWAIVFHLISFNLYCDLSLLQTFILKLKLPLLLFNK